MLLYRSLIRRRFCSSGLKIGSLQLEDFSRMGFEAMDFVVRRSSKMSCKPIPPKRQSDCLSYEVSFVFPLQFRVIWYYNDVFVIESNKCLKQPSTKLNVPPKCRHATKEQGITEFSWYRKVSQSCWNDNKWPWKVKSHPCFRNKRKGLLQQTMIIIHVITNVRL